MQFLADYKDNYIAVGMMVLVISVAFALAALRISALRSPPVVPELIMAEFIPKRNDKTYSKSFFLLRVTLSFRCQKSELLGS